MPGAAPNIRFVTIRKKCRHRITGGDIASGTDSESAILPCEQDPECPERNKKSFDAMAHCRKFLTASGTSTIHDGLLLVLEACTPQDGWTKPALLDNLGLMGRIISMLREEVQAEKSIY